MKSALLCVGVAGFRCFGAFALGSYEYVTRRDVSSAGEEPSGGGMRLMNGTQYAIAQFGFWTLGTLGVVDLIAATTNAFNGALLARRPDHYKHFTVIGIVLLGYAGGIGGGVLRDVLVNKIPSALIDPWYLIFALAASIAALSISLRAGSRFQDGLFQFVSAFTLPWYAIVGAQVALDAHLGLMAAVLIGTAGTTGGRLIIDVACNVVPKHLVRGHFWMLTAVLTASLYLTLHVGFGLSLVTSTALAVLFGFAFRLTSQFLGFEEFEPWEPSELTKGEIPRATLREHLKAEWRS